eukprot:608381-Rhodomonas_salina.1
MPLKEEQRTRVRSGRSLSEDEHRGDQRVLAPDELASVAADRLNLMVRRAGEAPEMAETGAAMRATSTALQTTAGASVQLFRAIGGSLVVMRNAVINGYSQLHEVCHSLGFHPAIAQLLYFAMSGSTTTAALFVLGVTAFLVQMLAAGARCSPLPAFTLVHMLDANEAFGCASAMLSMAGAVGSTFLFGGAAGTAVVGGSLVIPSQSPVSCCSSTLADGADMHDGGQASLHLRPWLCSSSSSACLRVAPPSLSSHACVPAFTLVWLLCRKEEATPRENHP